MNCKQLESLDATGLKNLKDACLDEALTAQKKGERSALRKLKYLSFNRCDFVSSSQLDNVLSLFPTIEILDFYGNKVD